MINKNMINDFAVRFNVFCGNHICSECPMCIRSLSNDYLCAYEMGEITDEMFEEVMGQIPINWFAVAQDTELTVWDEDLEKVKAHFAKYEHGLIYTFPNGTTHWSCPKDVVLDEWRYGELNDGKED